MNSFDVCCRNPLLSSSGQHILLLKEELDCRWWKMMSLTRKECHGKMALLSCQDQLDHCMYRSSVIYFTEFHVQSSPDFFLYFTYGHGSFLLWWHSCRVRTSSTTVTYFWFYGWCHIRTWWPGIGDMIEAYIIQIGSTGNCRIWQHSIYSN